ncbi:probable G-protein coupled receptor 173 [Lineus longissimus]|uniref:probable G-protein coupled receptor 173 n=1 Tax=Lineus longissimus TaxID=88925 RepID=UPI00315D46E7
MQHPHSDSDHDACANGSCDLELEDDTVSYVHPTPSDSSATIAGKAASLIVICLVAITTNFLVIYTIVKNKRFHRPPFYYMISLSAADMGKAILCYPLVVATVVQDSTWRYSQAFCTIFALANTFLTFGALFALFVLAVDRHMNVVHSHFHTRKFRGIKCLYVSGVGWGFAMLMAVPPVFGFGTYKFIPLQAQCTLEYKYFRDNDTLGFMLIFLLSLGCILTIYSRIFVFMRKHRKMRPIGVTPARSHNWTFFGPGATGQAITNWLQGFGAGPPHPAVVGLRNQPQVATYRLHQMQTYKNERLTQLYVTITCCFVAFWAPYVIMVAWNMFDIRQAAPHVFIVISTWISYAQVACFPFVYYFQNKAFRTAMRNRGEDYVKSETLLE